jgi:polar amino acid transport system substrate-binding protein
MRRAARRMLRRAAVAGAIAAVAAVALAGCGLPRDTDGTSERLHGGELRVGATHNPPWVDTSGPAPAGSEAELIARFAAREGAEIDWVEGSEGVLADALREGDIDVAIGGYTDDTPWTDKAAVSAVYREVQNDRGATEKHVVLARMGENRLLVDLESFLRENGAG